MISKKLFFLLFSCVLLGSIAHAQDSVYLFSYFKDNGQDGLHLAYSEDGLNWTALHDDKSFLKPTVANDKLMRDPCIIRGADGRFHMVWTVSWNDKGIGYASSSDLIHWSEQQFVPVMTHEDSSLNCWAPEITYDAGKKQYMIYWATTIPGRFQAGDTSGDGKYNHRIYYVTTKDFQRFSKTKLLLDPGFSVIDATIVPNGRQYVMILKDETRKPPQKNLKVAIAKKITGPYVVNNTPVTGKYWAEGPTVAQRDGLWIVIFDKYTLKQYGAVASKDLTTWSDISDQLVIPKGMRHGTVFKVSRAEFETVRSFQ